MGGVKGNRSEPAGGAKAPSACSGSEAAESTSVSWNVSLFAGRRRMGGLGRSTRREEPPALARRAACDSGARRTATRGARKARRALRFASFDPRGSALRKQLVRAHAPTRIRAARCRLFAQAHDAATPCRCPLHAGEDEPFGGCARASKCELQKSREKRQGPEKRRHAPPQKGGRAGVAGDLANRGQASSRERGRNRGERTGAESRSAAAKSRDRRRVTSNP